MPNWKKVIVSGSDASLNSVSANSVTASIFSGSLQGTSSWATNALTASSADNFTVRNTLTAQTIVVQTITSSIDYVTGSSRFGSLISNTHQFTGSVSMTGSLTVAGHTVGRGGGYLVENTVLGFEALGRNTSATRNTAIGWYAISSSTTNGSNTAVGAVSQRFNTGGTGNSSLGEGSLFGVTTGNYNTAVGFNSLSGLTNGTYNIGIGSYAGAYITGGAIDNTTSDFGIYLGYAAYASQSNTQNEIVIGANNVGHGSNTVTLGNTDITRTILRGAVSASGGITGSLFGTASFATSASWAPGGGGATFPYTGSAIISGSLVVTGSVSVTGSAINITRNANAQTQLNITNTTAGTVSTTEINLNSSTGAGQLQKRAASTNTFKILSPLDFTLYNTSGEIAIFNDAAGGIKFAAGGSSTTQMYLSGSGNFGIGTTSPSYKLHVADSAFPGVGIFRDVDVVSVGPAGQSIEIGARSGSNFIPAASIIGGLDLPGLTGNLTFQTRTGNALTTKMFISSSGNVGIGTTSPSTALHVVGAVSASAFTGSLFGTASFAVSASWAPSAGGSSITIADESVTQGTATYLNFLGAGVTAAVASNTASITISGGGGGGTPGGANTTIQFNDSSAFSGSGNFTFTKATNTVKIQGSGSVLLHITGSQGDLLRIQDSGSSPGTLATISSGSRNVLTVTTSSVVITGSLDVSGSFTASLQSGFAWVGNSNGRAVAISTSSIGGGGGAVNPRITAAANLFLFYNY